jgi:hypothetical protein
MLGTERIPKTGWRRGWDSDHLRPVNLRKLLILRSGRTDKTGTNPELRYTAGTRHGEIQLDR